METDRPTAPVSPKSPVRRRTQACERCRKRKQKCDRILPACTACVEAAVPCGARRVPLGTSTEDGSGLSHAAVPNYVESLKRKSDELDSQIRRLRARQGGNTLVETHHSPTEQLDPIRPSGYSNDTPMSDHTERSVQVAMGEIGFLSRNAMAEPRDETRAFPQELAMKNMIHAALAAPDTPSPLGSRASHHRRSFRSLVDGTDMLTQDIAKPYLDIFLGHLGMIFAHINWKETKNQFVAFFESSADGSADDASTTSAVTYRQFHAYMIVAIGMLLSPDPGIHLLASSLHDMAREKLPIIMETCDNLTTVHCILLLIHYSMLSPSGGSTWHLLGLAMNKSILLRLHKEPSPDSEFPTEEISRRRNLFWGLYTVDRILACVMDRPFSIQDDDISLKPPIIDTTPSRAFSYYVVMYARLMSSMRNSSYQRPMFYYTNICYWRRTLAYLEEDSEISAISSIRVKQFTCKALIQLVKLDGFGSPRNSVMGDSKTIRQDAISACQAYINEEYCRSEQGIFSGSFIDGLDIFAAGVTRMLLQLTLLPAPSLDPHFVGKCTALLTIIAERFASLKSLCRVLWALSNVASQGWIDESILNELPEIVPGGIYTMVVEFLRQARAHP